MNHSKEIKVVGQCEDGSEVENAILANEVDVILMDIKMPVMDGYKLTYEIRNEPRMSDLFIALNTSLSGSFNNAMVEKVGCNAFISKFQPDLLVDVVQTRLKQVLGKS